MTVDRLRICAEFYVRPARRGVALRRQEFLRGCDALVDRGMGMKEPEHWRRGTLFRQVLRAEAAHGADELGRPPPQRHGEAIVAPLAVPRPGIRQPPAQ